MKDLTGVKKNRLTAIHYVRTTKDYKYYWLFGCDCGNEIVTRIDAFSSGHTKSCGCLYRKHKEFVGDSKRSTVEYRAWCNMKRRCYDPTFPSYKYYGGRGIKVCQAWLGSFKYFLEDMGRKSGRKYSLD